MKINQDGLDLIKKFESLHDGNVKKIGLQPKPCPVGIWTEGYGRAMKNSNGKFLTTNNTTQAQAELLATITTESQAEKALLEDTTEFSNKIIPMFKIELNDNQFSACVSLAYNIGVNAFKASSVLKNINQNKFKEAADSFLLWNKARVNGKLVELAGLTRRRIAERELFLKDN